MSFLEAVNEKYGELSPVQKRIADYMYKYPDEACFYSLREMANALGVTEVTVLRFARKLGFDSYVDMKKNLRDHLQARLLGNETLRPASAHSMTGTREPSISGSPAAASSPTPHISSGRIPIPWSLVPGIPSTPSRSLPTTIPPGESTSIPAEGSAGPAR